MRLQLSLFVISFAVMAGASISNAGVNGTISGGALGSISPSPSPSPSPTPTSTSAPAAVSLAPCLPGSGHDYQVGPNAGQLSSLDQVPWENLAAGDTVRIFYRSTPYAGKFMIKAHGTAAAPVRVCGVKSSTGQRPIITGINATTRRTLSYGSAYAAPINESRGIIMIKGNGEWTDYPTYIQIDGLNIRGAYPTYTYKDTAGVTHNYTDFGGCIWVDRGQNITIADNEISDCTNGIFTRSTDDGDFAVTKNIRIAGNSIYGHGVVGDVHMHGTYIQSVNVLYEFNHFGPQRSGGLGNCLKDRSVGTVVRYNRFDGGAHSMDLVEAEDFPLTAQANPAYRTTYVYGNQVVKSGDTGSAIHYGGDHNGSDPTQHWGEPIFRKGTLYFWNNTVRMTGSSANVFQVATTQEKVEAFNNVILFDSTIPVGYRRMRATQEVNTAYWTPGGIVNLGRNFISSGWSDSDPYHVIPGQLNGSSNVISGGSSPIDLTTMIPLLGSAIVDKAQTQLSAVSGFPVKYQLSPSFVGQTRPVNGAYMDLGAVER